MARTTKKTVKKAIDNPVYQKIRQENERFKGSIAEIMKQHREFKMTVDDGPDKMYRVYFPAPGIEASVNQTYSKTYGRLLQDSDMLPEKQILENLTERGLWSAQKDKQITGLQERLARLRNLIYTQGETGMTSDDMEKQADDDTRTEQELDELISEKMSFTSNSIETRANETKIKDQVWQCVKEVKEGQETPVWNSLEAIDTEINRILLFRVINECVSFWQGAPSDFLGDLPETQNGQNDTPSQ
jgi:O6-methylguanine-DNA--protein-cysteine methyltransferase